MIFMMNPETHLWIYTGEGPRVQTRAMSWGVDMEAEAVRRYQVQRRTGPNTCSEQNFEMEQSKQEQEVSQTGVLAVFGGI